MDGIWHTGIVAFGSEWYFGHSGIECCLPNGTILGVPNEIINLGVTRFTKEDFNKIIIVLSKSTFKYIFTLPFLSFLRFLLIYLS